MKILGFKSKVRSEDENKRNRNPQDYAKARNWQVSVPVHK